MTERCHAKLEIDIVEGMDKPVLSITHAGGSHTLKKIFLRAGIEVQINLDEDQWLPRRPANAPFDPASLHQYLTKYRRQERAGWYGHVLIVPEIRIVDRLASINVLGLMYDTRTFEENTLQREGCALAGTTIIRGYDEDIRDRVYLHNLTHEIGHMFNLQHSIGDPASSGGTIMFQTKTMRGTQGFPDNYIFDFREDDRNFLSTAPEEFVRPGGKPFGARPGDPGMILVERASTIDGLQLQGSMPQSTYLPGEPVHLITMLHNEDARPIEVDRGISPNAQNLTIVVTTPQGEQRMFHPVTCPQ